MAMLAETRRRRNYTLVPKGKALYEDGDRFGTKMLEKFGWSKGKGLGANEDGEKDFVRIRYKRDNEGFGFEAKDDQWTQHEKDFTGLLKNLHGETEDVNEEAESPAAVGFGFKGTQENKDSMKEKLTGKSLVEMSKTSRARVHYQKFARGKDLSRASEKDLANIFGRKAPTEADNIFSAFQAVDNTAEVMPEEPKKEEKLEGVQIVNTGISISDYFKLKMEAIKLKRSAGNGCDEIPSKKSKIEDSTEETSAVNQESEERPKKKKKKDKVKEEVPEESEEIPEEKPKKKKKKSKENDGIMKEVPEVTPEESVAKPKKKKKKSKDQEKIPQPAEEEEELVSEVSTAKKQIVDTTEQESSEEKPKKKKKKVQEIEEVTEEPISKKKKKKSELDSENKTTSTDDEPSSQVPKTDPETTSEKEVEGEEEWQEVKSKNNKKIEPETIVFDDPKRYKINSYTAERFRNIDMPAFVGSNISQFKGYGLDAIEELEVYTRDIDDFKIREFWKRDLIIFDDADTREEFLQIGSHAKSANELLGMNNYRRKVTVARKENQKIPKLNLGPIKKRRAFTGI